MKTSLRRGFNLRPDSGRAIGPESTMEMKMKQNTIVFKAIAEEALASIHLSQLAMGSPGAAGTVSKALNAYENAADALEDIRRHGVEASYGWQEGSNGPYIWHLTARAFKALMDAALSAAYFVETTDIDSVQAKSFPEVLDLIRDIGDYAIKIASYAMMILVMGDVTERAELLCRMAEGASKRLIELTEDIW